MSTEHELTAEYSASTLSLSTMDMLYLPFREDGILLPDNSVVEICELNIEHALKSSPYWYKGIAQWRKKDIPVINFASLNTGEDYPCDKLVKVAVISGTMQTNYLPFYAIVLTESATLVSQNLENIIANPVRPRGRAELMSVSVGERACGIPNIEWIEQHLLTYILHS